MGLSTSLPPPEPNRRLLAFYNICAEYKKAIFKVSNATFDQFWFLSHTNKLFQGFKTKKELTALFSSYEVRRLGILLKVWEIPAVRCGEAGWTITSTKYKYK